MNPTNAQGKNIAQVNQTPNKQAPILIRSCLQRLFLILISLLYSCHIGMAQTDFNISLNKKIESLRNIQTIAFSETKNCLLFTRRNEFLIQKEDSILNKETTGIVYPPMINCLDDTIYIGHKTYCLTKNEFEDESVLFEKISSFFNNSYTINIEDAIRIFPNGDLIVHASYSGPSREIGAQETYDGPPHRLLLFKKNGKVKELMQSDIGFLSLAANKNYIIASSTETIVWNNKGEEINRFPRQYSEIKLHKNLNYVLTITAEKEVYILNTNNWHRVKLPKPIKCTDATFHPDKLLLFCLELDKLEVFNIKENTCEYILTLELEEYCNLLNFTDNKLIILNTDEDHIFSYTISY